MPTLDTYYGVYLWPYIPSLPLSIIFAVLFTVSTVMHSYKMTSHRLWFCLPFVLGILCTFSLTLYVANIAGEVIGYISRAIAWTATGSLIPYILQAIFLVIPPVLFAASLYMVYSRLVRAVNGQQCSLLSPHTSTRIFVLGDFICLNIQSSGSGLLASEDVDTVHIGEYIVMGGLILQILVFLVFMWTCGTFDRRFRILVAGGRHTDVPWKQCLFMLYATSVAILVRNVYRVVEFALGKQGYIYSHEWPAYVFDAALMVLVTAAFYFWHPSDLHIVKEHMVELTETCTSR